MWLSSCFSFCANISAQGHVKVSLCALLETTSSPISINLPSTLHRPTSQIPHLKPSQPNTTKMFTKPTTLSLLLALAPLLPGCLAQANPFESQVFYLTNCLTSDTQNPYSEVSIYKDVTQSFAGQNPDRYSDTLLGADITWEGAQVTWPYPGGDPKQPDKFNEVINTNAQDASIPTFTQVGCATFEEGTVSEGTLTRWACYKDSPRVLYTTVDHECTTLYYCRWAEVKCPFSGPGEFSI